MNQINLSETVIVSDPCYEKGIWCQIQLDIKPGTYNIYNKQLKFYENDETKDIVDERTSMLFAVHEDYAKSKLIWKEAKGLLGVDSGQCGFFSEESFRNDNEDIDCDRETLLDVTGCFKLFSENNTDGDLWYRKICSLLWNGKSKVGIYPKGAVCHSGFGDGSYRLYVAMKYNKVVAMCIDFAIEESDVIDFTIPAMID